MRIEMRIDNIEKITIKIIMTALREQITQSDWKWDFSEGIDTCCNNFKENFVIKKYVEVNTF